MSYPFAVFPDEVDYFVESLRKFQVTDIGSESWFEQNEIVLKLTQQAFIEASTKQEEVIKEKLLVEGKLPLLVHEAYCILVWRMKVLPQLLESSNLQASFVLYSVLYYEVNAIALLETLLFHQTCCEALGDTALDLIDYCAQALGLLVGYANNKHNDVEDPKELLQEQTVDEFKRMKTEMDFKIGLKCVSITSHLMNNLSVLPLSATNRTIKTHDVPCLIAEILHSKPWLRRTAKGFEKFLEGHWTPVYGDDILKVTKDEVQAWFCLYALLFNENAMRNYEATDFRRKEIGRCVGLLNDHILDQVPVLAQLKQFLCTFQMGSGQTGKQPDKLLLDELPEIKEALLTAAKKVGWNAIIHKHRQIFIELSPDEIGVMAKRLAAAYNTDMLEKFPESDHKSTQKGCFQCGKPAEKKCSKCASTFYCSRDCQVADWTKHKDICHHLKAL
ncbi:zinc finger MYND domain-containing protein 10 homolog [Aedes aegypti]|uniref:Zinc finger MYND domain-containing protein 10 n=1 Tax=Aedes aegypti TaxID=7159 RepID=A0A6R5HPK1_AEDAE|nr:zinc finger MYND domain-containing protein 10 homolog [Aedes aegypti]